MKECEHRIWIDLLDRASPIPFRDADPKCVSRKLADCTPEECPLKEEVKPKNEN